VKKQSGKLGRRVLSALAASAMVSSQVLSAMPFGAIAADGEVFPGDVNEDGKIDAHDAVMIENYATGKTSSIKLEAADVNADGKVLSLMLNWCISIMRIHPQAEHCQLMNSC